MKTGSYVGAQNQIGKPKFSMSFEYVSISDLETLHKYVIVVQIFSSLSENVTDPFIVVTDRALKIILTIFCTCFLPSSIFFNWHGSILFFHQQYLQCILVSRGWCMRWDQCTSVLESFFFNPFVRIWFMASSISACSRKSSVKCCLWT